MSDDHDETGRTAVGGPSRRQLLAIPACADAVPQLRLAGPGHLAACIRDDLVLTSSVKTAGRHPD
jgi:hypothetical protein